MFDKILINLTFPSNMFICHSCHDLKYNYQHRALIRVNKNNLNVYNPNVGWASGKGAKNC